MAPEKKERKKMYKKHLLIETLEMNPIWKTTSIYLYIKK